MSWSRAIMVEHFKAIGDVRKALRAGCGSLSKIVEHTGLWYKDALAALWCLASELNAHVWRGEIELPRSSGMLRIRLAHPIRSPKRHVVLVPVDDDGIYVVLRFEDLMKLFDPIEDALYAPIITRAKAAEAALLELKLRLEHAYEDAKAMVRKHE